MRGENLAKIRAAYNAKSGAGTVRVASTRVTVPRVSTGSFALDLALGGGIPIGHCTMAIGFESSAKTTNLLRVIGQAQQLCANCYRRVKIEDVEEIEDGETGEVTYRAVAKCDCYTAGIYKPIVLPSEKNQRRSDGLALNEQTKRPLYQERIERLEENSYEEFVCALIDVEGTLVPEWAESLGVDTRRLLWSCPGSGEEAADIYEDLIRTGEVDLVMLDSVAVMTPVAEVEEESHAKHHQGLQARLMNKLVRKLTVASNDVERDYGRKPTHLWVNQYRYKIGVMWGDPRTLPGGEGQNFYPSVKIEFRLSDFEEAGHEYGSKQDNQSEYVAARCNFKIIKNKTDSRRVGSFRFHLAGAEKGKVDELDFVEKLARQTDEIFKEGSKWYLGYTEFRSKSELLKNLYDNPIELDALKVRIVKKLEGRQ